MTEKELQAKIRELEQTISELERESAEKAAKLLYISEIFETSGNAINSVDLKGIITSWNPASERMFGYTAREAIGKSISIIKPRAYHTEDFLRRIKFGEKVLDYETQRRHKDDHLVDVSLNLSPIKDETGKIIGVSSIARDISEKKRLQRELFHSEKMAAIGKLASGIAHEFNNLIGIMRGFAELALSQPEPDLKIKALEVVINTSDRAGRIIKNLLNFSLRREPKKSTTDVVQTIERALALVSRDFEKGGIEVVREYSRVQHTVADEDQLEQVFLNIIINALHSMPNGGTLTLQVKKLDNSLSISFSDTGCGIKKEHLGKIFEPFFTTKGAIGGSEMPGTGLGLSIADGIIRNHGGKIEVESTVDVGTAFTVILPLLVEEEKVQLEEKAGEALHEKVPPADILLIDDEVEILEVVKRILKRKGHEVTTASSGRMAMDLIENREFDIVFSDVLMPGVHGLELLQFTKIHNPGTEVVLLTGKNTDIIEKDAMACGAYCCLGKPFEINTLISTVARIMTSKDKEKA